MRTLMSWLGEGRRGDRTPSVGDTSQGTQECGPPQQSKWVHERCPCPFSHRLRIANAIDPEGAL
jgi:hypothetical protein